MTTSAPFLSVAPGTESQGDALGREAVGRLDLAARVARAIEDLRLKAEGTLASVAADRGSLFTGGRHQTAAREFEAALAKIAVAYAAGEYRRVPGMCYAALGAAEAAVLEAEQRELLAAIEELGQHEAFDRLRLAVERELEKLPGLLGRKPHPDRRSAIRIVRNLSARIERAFEPVGGGSPARKGGADPERAKRENARRTRQLERSVGPKGPTGQSGPQHGNKKGGKK